MPSDICSCYYLDMSNPLNVDPAEPFVAFDGIGTREPDPNRPAKNKAAQELGRLGGRKGGPARAKSLTAAERSEIAKKAAVTRWAKKRSSDGGQSYSRKPRHVIRPESDE